MLSRIIRGKSLGRLFCTSTLPEREQMEYDVLIVGGGVAGLSAAIKIKQMEAEYARPLSVCVIEKGTEVGDHVLSGNCFEPRAFDELYPKWRSMDKDQRPPIDTPVTEDKFLIFPNEKTGIKVPNILLPSTINNHGNYIISLSKLTRWMGDQATELGVDIFPGTPGAAVLYDE